MKEIKLTKGKVAVVDDEDFDSLSKFKWYARKDARIERWDAARRQYNGGGRKEKTKTLLMHRELLGITDSKVKIDHINGNSLDNRKENLRIAKHFENSSNLQKERTNNTSGYRGVWLLKRTGKWQSKIGYKNKRINLGSNFNTAEEAARAYDKKAKELFGEFCGKLNLE